MSHHINDSTLVIILKSGFMTIYKHLSSSERMGKGGFNLFSEMGVQGGVKDRERRRLRVNLCRGFWPLKKQGGEKREKGLLKRKSGDKWVNRRVQWEGFA